MRIAVLIHQYSIMGATALSYLLESAEEIVAVVTRRGITKKSRSHINFLADSLKTQGIRYIFKKAELQSLIEFRAIFSRFLHRDRGNHIYFSLKEVSKMYDFTHISVDDINSKETVDLLKGLHLDAIFSMSAPYILKEEILSIPNRGCINLHRSVLPKYRGCKPDFWVRALKEKKTGYTFHFMTKKLDEGNTVYQKEIPINPQNDSYIDLMTRMALHLGDSLNNVIELISKRNFRGISQNKTDVTTFPCPKKADRIKYNIWD